MEGVDGRIICSEELKLYMYRLKCFVQDGV